MSRHTLSDQQSNAMENVFITPSPLFCITTNCWLLVFSRLDPTTPVRLALFLNIIIYANYLFKDIPQLTALALSSVNNMMCLFPCKRLCLSTISGSVRSLSQADGVQISGREGRCLSLLICPRETKRPDLCSTFHTSLTG